MSAEKMISNATGTWHFPVDSIRQEFGSFWQTKQSDLGCLDAPDWIPSGSIVSYLDMVFPLSIPREYEICPF